MACFDSSKGSLEEDSYEGAVGGELSSCALAMLEKERGSLLSPSESPSTYMNSTSSNFQAATPQQGYDVEFDPPLESKYECPICLMALRNAIQTPCGHRFCKNCIEKSIRDTGQRCPVDNEGLSKEQLFPDNFAKREILSLTVRCPNSGCGKKMELRHLENHVVHCQFATVPCPQCQQSVKKSHLEEHTTVECQRRPVSCPDCVATFVYEDREFHEQQCPFASVKCPYCELDLVRDQMESHCDTDCPNAPIACNFSTFGCKERMPRHDLAQHTQEFTQMHMRYMAEFLRSLSLNGTISKSLCTIGASVSFEDQGAAAQVSACSGTKGAVSSNCTPCQPNVEMQRLREMDRRLVTQDHQLRELIILKETQKNQPSFFPGLVTNDSNESRWGNDPSNGWGVSKAHVVRNDWVLHVCPPPGASTLLEALPTKRWKCRSLSDERPNNKPPFHSQCKPLSPRITVPSLPQAGQLAELRRRVSILEESVRELESQQCHGIFIWRLKDFSVLLRNQEAGMPVVEHSPGFYTGCPGYKLCLRLHLQSPNAQRCSNFISLFVHTMQGAYDTQLTWPFQGTIRLAILDQGPEGQHHIEVMEAKPDLQAFQKPTNHRNPKGFGYVTFLHLHQLSQRAFVKEDTLLIRCEVTPRFDNMLHREGVTVQARGPEASVMRD